MATRNFWIESEIAGRSNKLTGGPQAKEGWMTTHFFQRQNGESVPVVAVYSETLRDGTLRTTVRLLRTGTAIAIDDSRSPLVRNTEIVIDTER